MKALQANYISIVNQDEEGKTDETKRTKTIMKNVDTFCKLLLSLLFSYRDFVLIELYTQPCL